MICQRCLRLGLRPSTRPIYQSTRLSTSGAGSAEPPTTPAAQSPPPATSTAAAQPFSTPHQQSPSSASGIPKAPSDPIAGPGRTNRDESARAKAAPAVVSSVPAGTPLKGLNYFKNKEDPIALEDHEYPPWLWTLLQPSTRKTKGEGTIESDPRLYSKSAKARQMANKRLKAQMAAEGGAKEKMTPVYEQTVDLGVEEGERLGLNRAMREKRRGDIKTANFLRGMR